MGKKLLTPMAEMGYTFKYREVIDNLVGVSPKLFEKGKPTATWGRKASDLSQGAGRDRRGPADLGSDSRAAESGGPAFLSVRNLNTYQKMMRKSGRLGNVFIEYLMLSLLVAFGVVWFYNGAQFQGVRANVDSSFNNMINEIAIP
jgi:hypothetical protein